MPRNLATDHHKFDFTLIKLAEASYKIFQKSDSPEVKMLGILANFDEEDTFQVVRSIVDGIHSATKNDFAKSRYFRQLRIFVQLRNSLEPKFEKSTESVNTFFKEENDYLYRRGAAKKSHSIVENLILKLGLTDEQAADVAEVDTDYVKKYVQN
jgi:hypothetical protein